MEEKSYYSVIPANVRYDSSLVANAKLLFSELTALSNQKGYCWASNSYFAKLYKVSNQSVSKWINQLKRKGYITVEMEMEGKVIKKRIISIIGHLPEVEEVSIKSEGGINKSLRGYQQKFKDNTTINIKSNIDEQFVNFWNLYGKKVDRKNTIDQFNKLSIEDKNSLIDKTPSFVKANPDKKFRPKPSTFIKDRRWEDEIELSTPIDDGTDIGKYKDFYKRIDDYISTQTNIKKGYTKAEFLKLISIDFSQEVKLHFGKRENQYYKEIKRIITELNSNSYKAKEVVSLFDYTTTELSKAI